MIRGECSGQGRARAGWRSDLLPQNPSRASDFGANHLNVLMTSVSYTLITHAWKLLKSQALSPADQRSFVVGKD